MSDRALVRGVMLLVAAAFPAQGQTNPELKQILERLDRLERENETLRQEVQTLRSEIHPAEGPGVDERLVVQESRSAEQAQTKVESSQRFPIRLTGMALVNTFINSKQNGGVDDPTIAYLGRGNATGGASWHQTVIGLDYQGPQTLWGGAVRGSLYMDFFGGTSLPNNQLVRLRTAEIAIDWTSRSVLVGQEKPIFSPRNPDSLAQVGVAPLAGSGNLWFWEPQARFEQRFTLGSALTLQAQAGIVQTSEFLANVPPAVAAGVERYRPGGEGRVEIAYGSKENRRIEVASGFHYSDSHVAGVSVPSEVVSIDWLAAPAPWIDLQGAAYTGQNMAGLGLGAIRQAFTVLGAGNALPIHAKGGWSQLTLRATNRLTFHLMGGVHDGRNRDLLAGDIGDNRSYGGNIFYHLAPNVILSLEMMQTRTHYLDVGLRFNNHYDLALAYLF
jgi:uncharacterized protein (UPF0335 family)